MSAVLRARAVERALSRLAAPGAQLAPDRGGRGYAVFPNNDRRRRASARLTESEMRALCADGAIAPLGEDGVYVITDAGMARARRGEAQAGEAYMAQHGDIGARTIVERGGALTHARGLAPLASVRRLASLRDGDGAPFLAPEELRAAARLRADFDAGQIGLSRGADWTQGPRSGSARGAGNAQERAMEAGADARARVIDALSRLAPPLRRVVERACLYEDGLESIERAAGWPARSGKIALKLGLAQLAARR